MSDVLETRGVADLLGRLEDARCALADTTIEERVTALGRVAEGWLADGADLDATADAVALETGYAADMVAECLRRTLRAWSTRPLRQLLDRSLVAPGSIGTPPGLVVAVLAQNTPGLAVAPAFTALALGAAVLLKSARGEEAFAPRLAARIAAERADLGAACAARVWPGGHALEREVFARASRVVVYGPQEAIDAARVIAGERVVARGPRVSIAVFGEGGDPVESLAPVLAREVAFLDQRGCLSPQSILVAESIDRRGLAHGLAHELTRLETTWPRRSLSSSEASAFRRAVDETEARVLAGTCLELLGGVGHPWAVVVENDGALRPTPLDRFVRLHPFRDAAHLTTLLTPLAPHLECAALAAGESAHPALAEALRRTGAGRICAVGRMQDPPADWHAGGRRPVADLLTWSDTPRPPSTKEGKKDFLRFVAQTSEAPRGIEVDRARGSWVYAREGKRYLDLLAGIGVVSIGHAHPRVAAAVAEQSTRYTHVMVYGEDVLEPQVELAARLARRLPAELSVTYFTNSGAEAIEGALKLVRKATGRNRIVAFEGAYHGDTTGAMALGGNPFSRTPFEPLIGPVEHLPWNDVDALDRIDGETAAVFAEPVQAEAGVRIPAPDFLPQLAQRCRDVGALLVFDEVVTGLGRTGRWFGFEHWPGSQPDVIVLAKSLGGGLPLGAFISSPELSRCLATDPPLGHVTTFGGNPVSCAAGLAALDVLEEEGLPERAGAVGAAFVEDVRRAIGHGLRDVRGIGLLVGLEFETPARAAAFADACRTRGLLLGWTLHEDRVVRLAPPLNISRSDLAHAVAVFEAALGEGA